MYSTVLVVAAQEHSTGKEIAFCIVFSVVVCVMKCLYPVIPLEMFCLLFCPFPGEEYVFGVNIFGMFFMTVKCKPQGLILFPTGHKCSVS